MPTPEDLKPTEATAQSAAVPTDPEGALAFLGGRKFVLTALALVFIAVAGLTGKLPMEDAGQWGAAVLASYLGVNFMQGRGK